MEALIRAKNWADTALGPRNSWPQSFKTVVRILLTSRFAMWIGWGDDLTFLYNNACRKTLGIKHPWALGSSAREVWKEIWPDIGARIEHVLKTGEATWDEGLLLERSGHTDETYHTFSCSPLADDNGATAGILCVATEVTGHIIGERRLACLNALASDIARTNTRAEVLAAVERQLGAYARDLPFTLTYLFDEEGRANLGCATGVTPGHPIAPVSIGPADAHPAWPARHLLSLRTMLTVGDLQERFGQVPTSVRDKPHREVVIAPIARPGSEAPAGFLAAAVNPYRPPTDTNLQFINLLAGQIGSGLASADAYAKGRRANALTEINPDGHNLDGLNPDFARASTTGTPSGSNADDLGAPRPLGLTVTTGRVLLADKNADARDYVRRLLGKQGYLVEAVADGEAALAVARRRPPDLVLSDVSLPGLDGLGLLRALRDDPALHDVPVVLLSERGDEDERALGLDGGADDYLTKPLSARELIARVTANLKVARMRREAAAVLRARTIELETVLATVPAAVWFTNDREARHVLGNRQADAWLGSSDGVAASLSAPPQERPRFRVLRAGSEAAPETLAIRRAARGEEVHDDEIEVRFEDGKSLALLTHAAPLRDATGGVVGAVCAGIDISGRKRLEERFRLVVEAAPSALLTIGPAGRIAMVNARSERLFGYPRNELLGQPIELLMPERFRRDHPGARTEFFAAPVSRPMGEGRNLHGLKRDGSEFPIEVGLSPIETDEGTMVLAAVVDISERAGAARALAQSEAEFRASFEGAAVGQVLADPPSRGILRANRVFARMLGYEPEDLVGRSCPEFTWHDDLESDATDYARLVSGEADAIVREMRYLRRDGSPFWVRASTTIARADGSSDRTFVITAIEDIDTRHEAETALRVAKQELEKVVEERTAALNQRDLLLREVYHRVKNNLQLVDSLLMMQGRKIDDPQAKQALLSIRGRISALGLVHQQLMGSVDLKTFDVVPFLDDLSKNILDGVGTDGVRISVQACTLDVGLDFAVPLGLLVTELVTNSLKHAFPHGVGTISVTLRNENNGNLVLIVSDDGIGRTASDMSDNSRSGLGTRIITRLVDQLEGTIMTRNENGTTTEIRIPVPVQF